MNKLEGLRTGVAKAAGRKMLPSPKIPDSEPDCCSRAQVEKIDSAFRFKNKSSSIKRYYYNQRAPVTIETRHQVGDKLLFRTIAVFLMR
jgi:hypothetical protein